jgi:hypothetical protein
MEERRMRRAVLGVAAALCVAGGQASGDPLTWGSVVTRTANGCDAFTPVRGPDGHHYTSFGDCAGLTGKLDRVSMGFGRIIGGPANATVQDLPTKGLTDYGSRDQGQKPSSALMLDGRMYVWVRNYGPGGTESRLKYSEDFEKGSGSTWTWAPFQFYKINYPVFVQGAPGDYVYIVFHDLKSAYNAANCFILLRVPKGKLLQRSAYQFFSGTPTKPSWATYSRESSSIFTSAGLCYRSGMSYSKARGRYYWWQNTGYNSNKNAFRVLSSRNPWGPWTKVFGTQNWDMDQGERGEFPVSWMGSEPISQPGTLHLVFSGGDRLNIRRATIAAGY